MCMWVALLLILLLSVYFHTYLPRLASAKEDQLIFKADEKLAACLEKNRWVDRWREKWMGTKMERWTTEKYGWVNRWTGQQMEGQIWMERWMAEWTKKWVDSWTDGRTELKGWTEGEMDGNVDRLRWRPESGGTKEDRNFMKMGWVRSDF